MINMFDTKDTGGNRVCVKCSMCSINSVQALCLNKT